MVKPNLPALETGNKKTASPNNVRQIIDFLNQHYAIKINEFDYTKSEIKCISGYYELPPTIDEISLHLLDQGIQCPDSVLRKILKSKNLMKTYNPVIDYFDSLEFKGISHIDKLCGYLVARDFGDKEPGFYQQRLNRLFKKWLVATAATAMGNYANPTALGLINQREGIGKTQFFRFVMPAQLKAYYTLFDPKSMQLRPVFTKNLLVLFDELNGINLRTIENFNSIMTDPEIKLTLPREMAETTLPRIASAAFSTNRNRERGGFLTTSHGYRRFLCVEVENIDWEGYTQEIDVNQLWAEAVLLANSDFGYVFSKQDFDSFEEYNTRYMVRTHSAKLVELYLKKPENGQGQWLTPTEIMQRVVADNKLGNEWQTNISPEGFGRALSYLGFPFAVQKKGKTTKRTYRVCFVENNKFRSLKDLI